MESRGTLTLAFGRPKYIEMAKALARSLMLHAPGVPRAVVTDADDPELDTLFTHRIAYRPEFGSNVRQKMYLDQYSPFDETLFIDSDSLAVRSLDGFWSAFAGVPFGVCGVRTLHAGETDEYFDVDFALGRFGLSSLPKFNGGVYYFKRGKEATALFDTARMLLEQSAELRFRDFRGDGPADEAIYSVAMAIHGLTVTDMGTGGMWTPIDATSPVRVDVPHGVCTFVKRGRVLTPDILHVATFTESLFYLRECEKLKRQAQGSGGLSGVKELRLRMMAGSLWMQRKWKGLKRRSGALRGRQRMSVDSSRAVKPPTFYGIQALRGFAAVLVVLFHGALLWAKHVGNRGTTPHHWENGAAGVDLFFVISGFVMAVSTIGREHKEHPARSFLERRLIRIVPLYWLMTGLLLLKLAAAGMHPGLAAGGDAPQTTLGYVLASLFFIPYRNTLGVIYPLLLPGWTLQFEMFFYLLFTGALALRVSVARALTPVMLLLAAIGLLHPEMTSHQDGWPSVMVLASPMLLEFLAGLLLGRAVTKGVRFHVPVCTILGGLGLAVLLFVPRMGASNLRGITWGVPAFLVVLAVVALEERIGRAWPRWALLVGDASYSLYLSHTIALAFMTRMLTRLHVLTVGIVRLQDEVVTMLVCLAVAMVVGVLVYWLVEKPMTVFLQRRLLGTRKPVVPVVEGSPLDVLAAAPSA